MAYGASVAAHQTSKTTHDARILEHVYTPGDRVWMHREAFKKGESRKLASVWDGPYRVKEKLRSWTYRVQREGGSKECVVHHNQLKPCHSAPVPASGRGRHGNPASPRVRETDGAGQRAADRQVRTDLRSRLDRERTTRCPVNVRFLDPQTAQTAVGDSGRIPGPAPRVSPDQSRVIDEVSRVPPGNAAQSSALTSEQPFSCVEPVEPVRRSGRARRPPDRYGSAVYY